MAVPSVFYLSPHVLRQITGPDPVMTWVMTCLGLVPNGHFIGRLV
jgi:hypothetical protein